MLLVSLANGLSTLLLYSLQRPALYQWVCLVALVMLLTASSVSPSTNLLVVPFDLHTLMM